MAKYRKLRNMMDIRQVSSPTEPRRFDTQELRAAYLIKKIFQMGEICMKYSYLDRTVVGGAVPTRAALTLESNKQIGSPQFLDRRELGVFNIGGSGCVIIDNDTLWSLTSKRYCHPNGLFTAVLVLAVTASSGLWRVTIKILMTWTLSTWLI